MSADDYILVRQEVRFVGYRQCASVDDEYFDRPLFSVSSLREAIEEVQKYDTEYGYKFKLE